MPFHNNPSIVDRARRTFNFKAGNNFESYLPETIMPVISIKPILNVVKSTLLIAPTTLYTTPTDKDFYLTNAWVQVSVAEAANRTRIITATINGVAEVIVQISDIGAAAANSACSVSVPFMYPVKIDRGTAIVVSGSGTNGAAGIAGYTEEINNPSN